MVLWLVLMPPAIGGIVLAWYLLCLAVADILEGTGLWWIVYHVDQFIPRRQ